MSLRAARGVSPTVERDDSFGSGDDPLSMGTGTAPHIFGKGESPSTPSVKGVRRYRHGHYAGPYP
jgi:hypothetical protein